MAKIKVKQYSQKEFSQTMKGLTAHKLWDMDKKQLEKFLTVESKRISKNIENLIASGYGDYSPLLARRFDPEYDRTLPKPISMKEAKAMTIQELRNQITELSFIAKSQTSTIRGTKKYLKEFTAKTGRNATTLSPDDWKKIREKIEESPYGSSEIIATYDEQGSKDDASYHNEWDERIKMAEQARNEREQTKGTTFKVR